jgi:lysophospholipase L1-like esterase
MSGSSSPPDQREREGTGPPGWPRTVALLLFLLAFGTHDMAAAPAPDLRTLVAQGRIRTVVALGDSITAGYRLSQGWPELLQRELRQRHPEVVIHNAGCPGDTAADGLARLSRDVLPRKPDLVFISFGINDAQARVPPALFRRTTSLMVETLRKEGITPVLLTTTRLVMGGARMLGLDPEPYNRELLTLAADAGVPCLDLYSLMKGQNRRENYLDLVHLNTRGNALVADCILRALLP